MITVIVDANNILYRYFYGFDLGQPVNGLYYNAIKGWLKFLSTFDSKLMGCLKSENQSIGDSRMIVVFDNPETEANGHIEDYKSGRTHPPEISDQFIVCQHMTPLLGRSVIVAPKEIEADDVVSSLAYHFSKGEEDVVYVVTSDKDIMQCIKDGKRYVMKPLNGGKYTIMNEARVLEKFGVTPRRIPDLLSLMGDKSDGVPNVPGVGPVKAAKLIQDNGSLVKIFEKIDSMLHTKQGATINDLMEQIVSSYQATKLEKWPIVEGDGKSDSEKYIRCPEATKPDLRKLSKMLGNLGLKKLLPEIMSAY